MRAFMTFRFLLFEKTVSAQVEVLAFKAMESLANNWTRQTAIASYAVMYRESHTRIRKFNRFKVRRVMFVLLFLHDDSIKTRLTEIVIFAQ